MSRDEIISTLKLFNEKADKLRNSKFVASAVADSGVNLSWTEGQPAEVSRKGPDQENIDAFVLTLRFFLQDNEPISFRNLSTNIYSSSLISEEHRHQFERARSALNDFLDGNTMFNFGGIITRRELMNVFIFGDLSHANWEKKEKFEEWMASSLVSPFFENEFVTVLFEILNIVLFVQKLNQQVLADLT
jgi:hypothetical protein